MSVTNTQLSNGTPPGIGAAATRTRAVVALASLAVLVSYLPISSTSVALPKIAAATGANGPAVQWIMSLVVIPMAALILTFGVLGDLYGRRRIMNIGLVLAAAGATLATIGGHVGDDHALGFIYAGQTVAGIAAAALIPSTLAIISTVETDPHRRGKAIGMWSIALVLGLAFGALFSGIILTYLSWHWAFVPAIPAALALLVLSLRLVPESYLRTGRGLDIPGQILAVIAIVAIVDGVISGGSEGWSDPRTIIPLLAGFAALAGFVVAERRSATPMLDITILARPAFASAAVTAFLVMFAYIGLIFLLAQLFGPIQHLSPMHAADRYITLFVSAAIGSQTANLLIKRTSPQRIMVLGIALLAVGFATFTAIGADAGFLDTAWRLFLPAFGLGLALPTFTGVAINDVPAHQAGMASAGINAIRQFGGALGPAAFGVMAASMGDSAIGGVHGAATVGAVVFVLVLIMLVVTRTRPARSRDEVVALPA